MSWPISSRIKCMELKWTWTINHLHFVLLSGIKLWCTVHWHFRPRYIYTTDINQKSHNLHNLYSGMGLQLGVFRFLSRDQNNRDSLGTYVLQPEPEEMTQGTQRSWTHFVCVCFRVCSRQKPEYHQLELHGWRRHYTERYRSSGISFLYLWPTYFSPS